MRHLVAIVALAPLALLACGSAAAPSEPEATAAEAVIRCPVGYYYKCNGSSCSCVPGQLAPECKFDAQPAPYGYIAWVESWAVESSSGQCNDIPGTGGTWKQPLEDEVGTTFCGLTKHPADGFANEEFMFLKHGVSVAGEAIEVARAES